MDVFLLALLLSQIPTSSFGHLFCFPVTHAPSPSLHSVHDQRCTLDTDTLVCPLVFTYSAGSKLVIPSGPHGLR